MCVTIAVPFLNIDDGIFLSNIMQQSECTMKISLVSCSLITVIIYYNFIIHSFVEACGRLVNTSNCGSGGPGFKTHPSRCFLRHGTLLHFVSLHPGVFFYHMVEFSTM